ncbi:hypothetical protein [Sandaracinus amylolyticus]|uniref:GHMP family kinase ATP-binding protein n=1 Tax=Sandaracinus amylolyticus TaxID=927083 RepID=UPI001F262DF2|nr:hypothetical protein [Sandaracinus amylolyticus]UJR83867.1 Hypothetical protein I5071_59380 [Sandaracinus amylolyticus]
MVRVSAPGKVMISGEYVVLEGAPALVAAAPARARVTLAARPTRTSDGSPPDPGRSPDAQPLPPEALLARTCAESVFGPLTRDMDLAIDTSALRHQGNGEGSRKLGLGSSAAAAAGTVAAVAAANGLDVSNPTVRARLLPIALDGHRAVAPEGSGADVAASTLGGFVRVRRDGEHLDAARIDWPASLHLALVWTGTPARTSDLVAKVKSLAARDATAYQRAITPLREAAATLLAAIERGDARGAIDAAAAHHDAMQLLGETAGAPIVTPELTKAAMIAHSIGGSAKPSGAGGGDVAIAFLPSESAIAELGDACRIAGLALLPLRLGDDGVRVDEPLD